MIDLALDTQALTEYTNPFPAHTVHFHISMEGGEQQWGGNTTFINSFSKTFSNIKTIEVKQYMTISLLYRW